MRIKDSALFHQAGTTIAETLVAACLMAGFFATIFELNAVCLRYIDASKESVGALQGVQDRMEDLRGLTFASLTNATTIKSLMANPANSSEFVKKATETVTMAGYPSGTPTITFTRPAGATSTVTSSPSSVDFSSSTLVRLTITQSWTMTLGGRALTETTETIISAGNKKS